MTDKLIFKYNWQDISGTAVQGPELVATWASLSIYWNDAAISELVDEKSGSVKDNINLPLYPLAEWIALNWWLLLYEPFTAKRIDLREYNSRHNLSFAREGYALPNLSFRPVGEHILLEWKRTTLKNHQIYFTRSGQAAAAVENLEETLFDLVDKVVNRLYHKGISGTLLQEEWESIQQLSAEERDFCKIAALAGIDPFNISDAQSEAINNAFNQLPAEVIPDFFSSCDPRKMEQDTALTQGAIAVVRNSSSNIKALQTIKHNIQQQHLTDHLPWSEGYEAARTLRKALDLNGHLLHSIEEIGHALRISDKHLHELISYQKLPNSIAVVSGINQYESPCFVIDSAQTNARKTTFAYCRALYDYFFLTKNISLITRSHVENQKRNRAFAAEFLVPAEKLRQELRHKMITEEEIEDLADKFAVDPFVIKHQIDNHKLAEIDIRNFD